MIDFNSSSTSAERYSNKFHTSMWSPSQQTLTQTDFKPKVMFVFQVGKYFPHGRLTDVSDNGALKWYISRCCAASEEPS